uniref:Uncharacterized protein n=1 Tax=Romanomermis culicivorax TaxID=13658 RepID=A0A915JW47_ROMCU
MYDLTDAQCAIHKKLKDGEKNLIMYAHLGTDAIRWFKHSPAMGKSERCRTMSYKMPSSQCSSSQCGNPTHFTGSECPSNGGTNQRDCKYDNFNADTDLAYMLAQDCYLQDTQEQLFSSHAVTLDVYVNIMQAA